MSKPLSVQAASSNDLPILLHANIEDVLQGCMHKFHDGKEIGGVGGRRGWCVWRREGVREWGGG